MAAKAIDIVLGRHAMALAHAKWGGNDLAPLSPYLAGLCETGPAPDLHRRWHVVQTEPQQEGKVAKRLTDECGLDCYHPREPKSIRVNGHKRRIEMRSMVVGYVFAGFDRRLDAWQGIPTLRGVLRLFMIDSIPVPVPDKALIHIREREAELALGKCRKRPVMPVTVGDWVQFSETAWCGLIGQIIELLDSKEKIIVEIDVFGRQTPVEVSVNQVRAV